MPIAEINIRAGSPIAKGAIAAFILATLAVLAPDAGAQPSAIAFENGRWFNGEGFERGTFYAVDGVLTSERPDRVEERVNLKKGYVVPPYGEAHNHNVDATERGREMLQRYLRDGIFYVKNPNNLPQTKRELAPLLARPDTPDVTFANGGLTAPGGHPVQIAERGIEGGWMSPEDGEGGFYHTIETAGDLDRKWDAIVAGDPDFIKTYLLYSEEYEKRKDNPEFQYWRGLDPSVLPAIVERAHGAGLRVSTHIETAADFEAAVNAGVDEINHTPGFRPQPGVPLEVYRLTDAQAKAAADSGVFVVTTLGGIHPPEVRELHRHNLRTLKEHGVPTAIGSDQHNYTATIEARYLDRLDVFTNLELLKAWCETTPATIFPARKIGRLADGYEANFLVLEDNPLDDFSHTGDIRMRVKAGIVLDLGD